MKLNSTKYMKLATVSRGRNLFESVLLISALTENDLSTYECEAMNELGVNRLEIELVTRSPPERPSELRALHVDFMSATLAWSPGFDGGLDQTFFLDLNDTVLQLPPTANKQQSKNAYQVVQVTTSSVNLTGLQYDTVYSVRLMARNRLGSSDWTERTTLRTDDLTEASTHLLPHFDALFLNVPKNRLEFEFKNAKKNASPTVMSFVPICIRLVSVSLTAGNDAKTYSTRNCLSMAQNDFLDGRLSLENEMLTLFDDNSDQSTDNNKKPDIVFDAKTVKSMKVSLCFAAKPTICENRPTSAIIGNFSFPITLDYHWFLVICLLLFF